MLGAAGRAPEAGSAARARRGEGAAAARPPTCGRNGRLGGGRDGAVPRGGGGGRHGDAVGARVYIRENGKTQLREVVSGDGYGSQNALRQYFGLGDKATVAELVVKWPRTGKEQTFRNVAADRIIRITEGADAVDEPHYVAAASAAPVSGAAQ